MVLFIFWHIVIHSIISFVCVFLWRDICLSLWNSYASSTAWLWNILALLCFSLWLALCSNQSLLSYRQGEATLIMANISYICYNCQCCFIQAKQFCAQWHLHVVLSLNKDDVANWSFWFFKLTYAYVEEHLWSSFRTLLREFHLQCVHSRSVRTSASSCRVWIPRDWYDWYGNYD